MSFQTPESAGSSEAQSLPMVLTISRQLGSGGSFVGQRIATELGIAYVDRQILRMAAEKLEADENELEARDENPATFWGAFLSSCALTVPGAYYVPPGLPFVSDQALLTAEWQSIRELVSERPAVVVGRAGFHLLRARPHHLSVFLHASPAYRARRIEELYRIPAQEAERLIRDSDAARARFVESATGRPWTDATLYDLALDTEKLGLELTQQLIRAALAAREVFG